MAVRFWLAAVAGSVDAPSLGLAELPSCCIDSFSTLAASQLGCLYPSSLPEDSRVWEHACLQTGAIPRSSSSFWLLFVLFFMVLSMSRLKMPVMFYFSTVLAVDNSYQFSPIYYYSSFIFPALHFIQIQVSRLSFMPTPLVSDQVSLFSPMFMTFTFDYLLWSSKAYHTSPCKL